MHALTVKNVETIEEVDKAYLRSILSAHSKVGLECLYLPLKYNIMQRRLLYLWHSQKLSPSPGHWVKMVEMDKNKVGLILDDQEIEKMSKSMFQKVVKNKVETYALTQLEELKKKHSKSGRIESKKFET